MENNDYVKVVRCKNCKHYQYKRYGKTFIHECTHAQWWDAEFGEREIDPEDFCSYGEERDREEKL